ncbi:MAG: S8 family serine peptidase [Bryobacteraceae bacterium]|jgi:thermitase
MRTFQGRPIATIVVDGEEVEIVKGIAAKPRFKSFGTAAGDLAFAANYVALRFPGADRAESDESAEPVYIHYGAAGPNNPRHPEQWGLSYIHAERAWKAWHGDAGSVVLAVLDTGIPMENGKLSHPDLAGGRFVLGLNAVAEGQEPRDDHGHGSHVTGIAAAARNSAIGIAGLWQGRVYAVKVLDSHNRGTDLTFEAGVAAALDFAAKRHTRLVINYSGYTKVDNRTMRGAVEDAADAGALLVCAAGNENGGKVRYPACYSTQNPTVVAVGATDRSGALCHVSSDGPEITLCAPGQDILSTLPNYPVTWNTDAHKSTDYDIATGTSMACPFVAALAAMVWSQKPSAAAADIRAHLIATALSTPPPLLCGIIDAGKALEKPL